MSSDSMLNKLQELFDLLKSGELSRQEFNSLKNELLTGGNFSITDKKEPTTENTYPLQQEDSIDESKNIEEQVLIPKTEAISNQTDRLNAEVYPEPEASIEEEQVLIPPTETISNQTESLNAEVYPEPEASIEEEQVLIPSDEAVNNQTESLYAEAYPESNTSSEEENVLSTSSEPNTSHTDIPKVEVYPELKTLIEEESVLSIPVEVKSNQVDSPKVEVYPEPKASSDESIFSPPIKVKKNNQFDSPNDEIYPEQKTSRIKIRNAVIAVLVLVFITAAIFTVRIYINKRQSGKDALLVNGNLMADSVSTANSIADSTRLADSLSEAASLKFSLDSLSNVNNADYVTNVLSVISNYYTDLKKKTFNANLYFADNVERFIIMTKTHPSAINTYINKSFYKEYVDAGFEMEANSYKINKQDDGCYSIEYIEKGVCYIPSRQHYQKTRVNVRVSLNQQFRITLFQQYRLIENATNKENIF